MRHRYQQLSSRARRVVWVVTAVVILVVPFVPITSTMSPLCTPDMPPQGCDTRVSVHVTSLAGLIVIVVRGLLHI